MAEGQKISSEIGIKRAWRKEKKPLTLYKYEGKEEERLLCYDFLALSLFSHPLSHPPPTQNKSIHVSATWCYTLSLFAFPRNFNPNSLSLGFRTRMNFKFDHSNIRARKTTAVRVRIIFSTHPIDDKCPLSNGTVGLFLSVKSRNVLSPNGTSLELRKDELYGILLQQKTQGFSYKSNELYLSRIKTCSGRD